MTRRAASTFWIPAALNQSSLLKASPFSRCPVPGLTVSFLTPFRIHPLRCENDDIFGRFLSSYQGYLPIIILAPRGARDSTLPVRVSDRQSGLSAPSTTFVKEDP